MNIASRIRFLRKLSNLTQEELSTALDISKGNLSDWERGRSKPGSNALVNLSNYFDVPIDWILMGTLKTNFSLEVLSEKIKTERKEKGMTLEYLTKRMSMPIEDYIALEDGNFQPTDQQLVALSIVLSCSLSYLIDDYIDAEYVVVEDDQVKEANISGYVVGKAQAGKTASTTFTLQQLMNASRLLSSDLDDNEKHLVSLYRELSIENRLRLEGYVRALIDIEKESISSSTNRFNITCD